MFDLHFFFGCFPGHSALYSHIPLCNSDTLQGSTRSMAGPWPLRCCQLCSASAGPPDLGHQLRKGAIEKLGALYAPFKQTELNLEKNMEVCRKRVRKDIELDWYDHLISFWFLQFPIPPLHLQMLRAGETMAGLVAALSSSRANVLGIALVGNLDLVGGFNPSEKY